MLRLRKGVAKFGGKKPNKAAIKLPLRDGDIERDDEAYKGHYKKASNDGGRVPNVPGNFGRQANGFSGDYGGWLCGIPFPR